jgi:hypothetical protein
MLPVVGRNQRQVGIALPIQPGRFDLAGTKWQPDENHDFFSQKMNLWLSSFFA